VTIRTFDYLRSLSDIEEEVHEAVERILHSGKLILGPETDLFEQELQDYLGVEHCIAVTSGTTALHLALFGLGVGHGDEVITVANTCVPTISAIRLTGATPVFVDVRTHDLMMDADLVASKITARTRCILPVHLWGQCVDMDKLREIAETRGLFVVEDCAQAFGSRYKGRPAGTLGHVGCFSFYPTKNLGAYGDAGAIVTRDKDLAARLRSMRMYGYDEKAVSQVGGMNARISEIQAAILRIKLRRFPDDFKRRIDIASTYNRCIENEFIDKPVGETDCEPSYHQYVVRCAQRERLAQWLRGHDIGFGIHYPVPVHLMPAYEFLGYAPDDLPNTVHGCSTILSLPVHENLRDDEVEYVVDTLNQFSS